MAALCCGRVTSDRLVGQIKRVVERLESDAAAGGPAMAFIRPLNDNY